MQRLLKFRFRPVIMSKAKRAPICSFVVLRYKAFAVVSTVTGTARIGAERDKSKVNCSAFSSKLSESMHETHVDPYSVDANWLDPKTNAVGDKAQDTISGDGEASRERPHQNSHARTYRLSYASPNGTLVANLQCAFDAHNFIE